MTLLDILPYAGAAIIIGAAIGLFWGCALLARRAVRMTDEAARRYHHAITVENRFPPRYFR